MIPIQCDTTWKLVLLYIVATIFLQGYQCQQAEIAAPILQQTPYRLNTTVAVVTMIKNEGDILNYWLEYHSALFGVRNLVVLDNFSTDNTTIGLLIAWKRRGLRVAYKQGPYAAMGDLVYNALKKHFPKYQLAIPLDVDEFLIAYQRGVPIANHKGILMTIDHVWNKGGPCFSFRQYYASYPTHVNDTIATVELFTKAVYRSKVAKKMLWLQDIQQIAFGAHQGTLHGGEEGKLKCSTDVDLLGLLHYHLRNPRVTAERALRDSIALKYLPKSASMDTLQTFIPKLEKLVREHERSETRNHVAFHKIQELLTYAQNGDSAFAFEEKNTDNLLRVGTIQQIIDAIKHTS